MSKIEIELIDFILKKVFSVLLVALYISLSLVAVVVIVTIVANIEDIKELKQTQKQLIIKIKNDSILHSNRLLQHQNGIKLIDTKN